MELSPNIQLTLFQKIKETLPPGLSLADEIADVLHISLDSAYRRLRGEKPLVFEEVFLLATKFNFSVDDIFNLQTKGSSFYCRIVESREISFEDYLKNIYDNLIQIQLLSNPEIIYFAKDIPIFHHFQYPRIAAFKLFFWSKTIIQHAEFKDKNFSFDIIDEKILEIGRKALSVYSKIPSVEIWNEETVTSVLRQIEFYLDSGIIAKKEDALALCDEFNNLFDHIKLQAEQGCKFFCGKEPIYQHNFKLYNNEVILGDNSISVTSDIMKITYIPFNVLSLMVSTEKGFCEKVENYLRTMMKKSSLISEDSEKERNRFFNMIRKKVQASMDKIRNE